MKRLFIAIKINFTPELKGFYTELQKILALDNIKWTVPENMHLTLAFLGNTPDEKIKLLNSGLQSIAEKHNTFNFKLKGLGVFKSINNPTVLWIGIESTPILLQIKQDIDKFLISNNFIIDQKGFNPHLTLGRIKKINNQTTFKQLIDKQNNTEFQKQEVEKIILYESVLFPNGPVYKALSCYDLNVSSLE